MLEWNNAAVTDRRSRDRTAIAGLFSRMARHYDLFNRLASFGVDGWWRWRALWRFPRSGRVLDLGCGGGQMAARLSRLGTFCVGVDPSFAMLAEGRRRRRPFFPVQAAGEALPFRDGSLNGVVSAFVMRNLEDLERTMQECRRVLRPGGRLVILEFFPPTSPLIRTFFRIYLGGVVTWTYRLLTRRGGDAAWLYRSIAEFRTPKSFQDLVESCGFADLRMRPLVFRIAWRLEAVRRVN